MIPAGPYITRSRIAPRALKAIAAIPRFFESLFTQKIILIANVSIILPPVFKHYFFFPPQDMPMYPKRLQQEKVWYPYFYIL